MTFPIAVPKVMVVYDKMLELFLLLLFAHSPPLNHFYQPLAEAEYSYLDQR